MTGNLSCLCTQDFAEEEQEFQAGIDDGRFRRRVRTPSSARAQAHQQQPTDARAEADAIIGCYVRCLQHGLQARPRPPQSVGCND